MEELKKGDIVQITTKIGPEMTINKIVKLHGYECLWFQGQNLHRDWFEKEALYKVEKK